MKKTLLFTTIALALAAPAFADTNTNNGAGNVITTNNGAGSGSVTTDSNNPHLTATGGNATAFGGSARSTALSVDSQKQGQAQSANNNGNAQSVTQNYQRPPVSSANAAPIVPSANCMGVASAAFSAAGFAAGGAKSYEGEDCVTWFDSNNLAAIGLKKASIKRLCMEEKLAEAMSAEDINPCELLDKTKRATASRPHFVTSDTTYPQQPRR